MLDMETMEMTYLYAGPKVRGVYYEQNTGRLYFASKRGIGYFDMAEADPFPRFSRPSIF
ncbi:MAG: hypothetical protein M5R36_09780 [Deltaproteobacteria bacterium]|nr:hypothetical protein [Deltaproteobacteria bacterium]